METLGVIKPATLGAWGDLWDNEIHAYSQGKDILKPRAYTDFRGN
jgi:hypothetical protein